MTIELTLDEQIEVLEDALQSREDELERRRQMVPTFQQRLAREEVVAKAFEAAGLKRKLSTREDSEADLKAAEKQVKLLQEEINALERQLHRFQDLRENEKKLNK